MAAALGRMAAAESRATAAEARVRELRQQLAEVTMQVSLIMVKEKAKGLVMKGKGKGGRFGCSRIRGQRAGAGACSWAEAADCVWLRWVATARAAACVFV